MGAYITRRLLWTLLLLWVVSGITFLIFNVLPSADPAAAARGSPGRAGGRREHPPHVRPRQADLAAVPRLHEGGLLPRRLRPLVPQRRRRPLAAVRPAAQHDLPDRRRGGRVADDRHSVGMISAVKRGSVPRPLLDGDRAGRHLRARLLARARRPLPVRRRHRALPDPAGLGRLPDGHQRRRQGARR